MMLCIDLIEHEVLITNRVRIMAVCLRIMGGVIANGKFSRANFLQHVCEKEEKKRRVIALI